MAEEQDNTLSLGPSQDVNAPVNNGSAVNDLFDFGNQPTDDPAEDSIWSALQIGKDTPLQEQVPNPITANMIALSRANPDSPAYMLVKQEEIEKASQSLAMDQEFQARMQVAHDRTIRMASTLKRVRDQALNSTAQTPFTQDFLKNFDTVYNQVLTQRAEDDARTSLEYETVERVQDLLTAGNSVEAKLTWDLFQKGDAQKRMHDYAVKNLIMAQRVRELETAYEHSGWGRWLGNFVTQLIPTRLLFDSSGIINDANAQDGFSVRIKSEASGVLDWLLRGRGLNKQAEALWNLSPSEFAEAMAKDGPIMSAIHSNAGLFFDDPGTELELLKSFQAQSESDTQWKNLWGAADLAFIVPWSKAASIPKSLIQLGARDAAASRVADAYAAMIEKGAAKAEAVSGMSADEITESLEHSAFNSTNTGPNTVNIAGDAHQHIAAAEEALSDFRVIAPSRFDSPEELVAAYETRVAELKEEFGKSVKDVNYTVQDVASGHTYEFNVAKGLPEQGNSVHTVEVTFGKPQSSGGYANVKTATSAMNKSGYTGEVFQDASGQWFYKAKFALREKGFITAPLETGTGGVFNGLRSVATFIDPGNQGKALQAGNATNKTRKAFHTVLKESLAKVSKEDKGWLDQIIRKGQNLSKWFNEDEFVDIYKGAVGKDPDRSVINAYNDYIKWNDVDFLMRRNEIYMQRHVQGAESVNFTIGKGGLKVSTDAIVELNPESGFKEVWDASAGRLMEKADAEEIKKLSAQGYVHVKSLDDIRLPDGRVARDFLIKKSELSRAPLRRDVIGYSEGGHRMYKGSHFVKQTATDAGGRLLNPHVFITGNNKNVLQDWADKMNSARAAWKAGEGKDPQWLDDNIFLGDRGLPTGEEFIKQIEAGNISKNHDLEVVFDREMPKAYQTLRDDVVHFVDPGADPLEGLMKSRGRMYYSRKGDALKNSFGDFAETVDPWETLNQSLTRITKDTTFSNYKLNTLQRFKRTYGPYLQLKDLDSVNSLYELVNAPIKQGIGDPAVIKQIKNQQAAIKNVLGFQTGFDRWWTQTNRSISEWILGDAKGGWREGAYDAWEWSRRNNPVQALKSFAFDTKLGMWNWGQLPIQASTMLAAIALSPKYGFQGMHLAPLIAWKSMGSKSNTLDLLAERGLWKPAGFSSATELKYFAKLIDETGVLAVDSTHALLNKYGSDRVFGSVSKLQAAREAGRFFFYSAEKLNRVTAARIAYGEAIDAGLKPGTANFREAFLRGTDKYSFNMMGESAARFQHGLMSIPSQFWAYSFRMADAMLGKQFTKEQKTRLIFSQFVLAGSAGIPAGEVMSSLYQKWTGDPITMDDDHVAALFDRGVVDSFINWATGADVQVGAKIGTQDLISNVVKDLFGYSQYGEKSLADIVVGATGSTAVSIGPAMFDVVKYATAESGGETGIPVTEDALLRLAVEVSSVSNALKAYSVYNYGQYKTKKGQIQVSGLPSEAAFFIAAGIVPGQLDTLSAIQNIESSRKEAIKEAARKLENWRQEAFTNHDKYYENMQKSNAFVQMLDPSIRVEVLNETHRITDPSLYDRQAKKFMEEQMQRENVEGIINGETD